MFEKEPPADWALAQLPQVVATPHIAASTEEAQELVGLDTAATVRDFLRDGVVRNAVNFPSMHPDELQRLQPWIRLVGSAGARSSSQMGAGAHRGARRPLLRRARREPRRRRAGRERGGRRAAADPVGRRLDRERARGRPRARHRHHRVAQHAAAALHEPASRSSCTPSDGERWVEGTVFEPNSPRLVSVRGVNVEAPLGGTMLIICNDDQPGVIGEVGTILGRHGVNIANFALGRSDAGAIGVVNVDEEAGAPSALDGAVDAIRKVPAVREAWVVRLCRRNCHAQR